MSKPSPIEYSQIKAMLAIAKASFRSMIRNPSAVVFSLAFPLIFIIVFGFIKGTSIRLEVGVDSTCDTSNIIYNKFSSLPNVDLVKDKSSVEMLNLLHKGRMDGVLKINSNEKDNTLVVEIITSKASREKGMFVKSILSSLIDKQNLGYLRERTSGTDPRLLNTKESSPIAELRETDVPGREYKMIDFILPGQLGFSILSAGVFGTAFIFFSFRQTLVLKRFFATPIKRTYIILGETLSRLLFQLTGSLIIILLGKYFFGFTLIHGWITLIQMLLLSAAGLIIFMGFGFVVSGIAKSESVIPPLANVITLPQFLLSGTFFPVDAFPPWLQHIGKALPLTYLNDGLRKIAFEGADLISISDNLLILAIWGVIIYFAAIRFFKWE
jgi:ABC-2 type transport system permease protein